MKLKNNDVVSVVNEVLRDLMADAKIKTLSLEQIQDVNKELKVTNLTNGASNAGQKIAEMIIASGALRQLERHWEDEEKVDDEEKIGQAKTQTEPKQEPIQKSENNVSKDAINKAIQLLNRPNGKQAAMNYLRQLVGEPTNNTNNAITASNGKSYYLTVGANGDRIWHNSANAADEASGNIERELEAKSNNLKESIRKLRKILETASSGSTASGSIASVANPMGATISRTPNLFGYVPYQSSVKLKKRKKQPKNTS
jgi:hypothetical protein